MKLWARTAIDAPEVRVAALWWVAAFVWSSHMAPAGYLLTFDDVWRLIHANESRHGAIAPSQVWPPLQFWVLGVALHFIANAALASKLINLTVTAVTLVQVGRLAAETGQGRIGRYAAAISFGTLPFVLWVAPSALVEPWTLLAGIYALRRARSWWIDGDSAALRHAFLALGVGAMTRYEAWGWLVLLMVASQLAPRRGRVAEGWHVSALLAFLFPLAWCAAQFAWSGNPFNFGVFAYDFLIEDHPGQGLWGRTADAAVAMFEVGLPLAVAGLAGSFAATPGLRLVWGATLGAALLQVVAHAVGLAGLHNVWRHHLHLAVPLALGAGVLVERAAALGRPAALGVLSLVLHVQVLHLEWPPVAYEDDLQAVALHLRPMREGVEGTVLIEATGYEARVLQILLGDMDDARFDRLIDLVPLDRPMTDEERGSNHSLLDLPYRDLAATLQREQVRWIATFTKSARTKAAFHGTMVIEAPPRAGGQWVVFRVGGALSPAKNTAAPNTLR